MEEVDEPTNTQKTCQCRWKESRSSKTFSLLPSGPRWGCRPLSVQPSSAATFLRSMRGPSHHPYQTPSKFHHPRRPSRMNSRPCQQQSRLLSTKRVAAMVGHSRQWHTTSPCPPRRPIQQQSLLLRSHLRAPPHHPVLHQPPRLLARLLMLVRRPNAKNLPGPSLEVGTVP